MKMNRVIVMLRDENVDLRAKNVDIQTDYVILDESYKNFITVSNIDESSTSINRNTHDSLSFERGGGGRTTTERQIEGRIVNEISIRNSNN